MSIEAMKQALEALEKAVSTCFDGYAHEQVMSRPEHFINQTITSLHQAIEQAEKQEPVAWMDEYGDVLSASTVDGKGLRNIPLYTTPPAPQREWVGLTDEEINDWRQSGVPGWAIEEAEAKLKEKNNG